MTTVNLEKLLKLAGPELLPTESQLDSSWLPLVGKLGEELRWLLLHRNGFHAFESALHVFPTATAESELGIEEWNSLELWRSEYGDLAENCMFFAEDIFGGQFGLARDGVFLF